MLDASWDGDGSFKGKNELLFQNITFHLDVSV